MSALDIPEVKELFEEWKRELEMLERIDLPPNTLDNSVNMPRIKLEQKYKKKIQEVLAKHSV